MLQCSGCAEAEAPVSSSSNRGEGGSGLPYGMPPGVWAHVAATNIRLQREQHCLSAPYFRSVPGCSYMVLRLFTFRGE